MIRTLIAFSFLFVTLASADPDKSTSGKVSGGASRSVGEKPQDEAEGDDGQPGCDEDLPNLPMLWTFESPRKAALEAVKKLFKAYPGEVSIGEIVKGQDGFELQIQTFAKTGKDEEKFSEAMEKKVPGICDDISWGCRPDEKRIKEMEKAKEEQQKEEDSGKSDAKDGEEAKGKDSDGKK